MKAVLLALLALSDVGTSSTKNSCQMDERGFCTDQVVRWTLSNDAPDPIVRINVALGTAVSIEFPPYVATRGDLPVGNKNILDHKVESDGASPNNPLRITLWPKMPPGIGQTPETALHGHKTNLHIMLDSGLTIILEVKLAPSSESTQRLLFDFPDRHEESAYVREKVAEGRQRVMAELAADRRQLDADIKQGVKSALGRGMLSYEHCQDLRMRGMQDLLIVRATRICRIGEHVFLRFSIKNRARDLFSLGSIIIQPSDSESEVTDVSLEFDPPGSPMLGFDSEVRGVAVFEAKSAPSGYSLTVHEAAGKKRHVTLEAGF